MTDDLHAAHERATQGVLQGHRLQRRQSDRPGRGDRGPGLAGAMSDTATMEAKVTVQVTVEELARASAPWTHRRGHHSLTLHLIGSRIAP
jgi:hypothetical protein